MSLQLNILSQGNHVQCSRFIMLYLGSIRMDPVISEPCYKGAILQRNYRNMTRKWSFFPVIPWYVKFQGKKNWKPYDYVISKFVL